MQQGGPGAQRFDRVEVLAIAFALLQVAFLVSCVAFGVGGNRGGHASRWPIIAGGVLFAATFCFLFAAYRQYAGDAAATPAVLLMVRLTPKAAKDAIDGIGPRASHSDGGSVSGGGACGGTLTWCCCWNLSTITSLV